MNENLITIHLVDFLPDNNYQTLLKNKFNTQQISKTKYLLAKQLPYYSYTPIEFMHDEGFLIDHVWYWPPNLPFKRELMNKDREFKLKLAKKVSNLEFPMDTIDRQFALDLVKTNPSYYKKLSLNYKNDREIALEAVKRRGNILEFMDETFRKDLELVKTAVKNKCHYDALKFANEKLKNEKIIVFASVETSGMSLMYASKRLKNDRKIVLKAVKQHGCALQYANDNLKQDREIVMEAIKNTPEALYYASGSLKDDFEIVKMAVDRDLKTLAYASERLRNEHFLHLSNDSELLLNTMQNRKSFHSMIGCASQQLRGNKQFVLKAIELGAFSVYADQMLRQDTDVLIASLNNGDHSNLIISRDSKSWDWKHLFERILNEVKSNQIPVEYLPDGIRNNKDLMLKVLRMNGMMIQNLPKSLQQDEEIIDTAMNQNVESIRYLFSHSSRKDLLLRAVKQNGLLLEMANATLKMDLELIRPAVKQNGLALNFVNLDLLEKEVKEELEREAVRNCGFTKFYSEDLFKLRMETCYNNCKL